MVLRGRLEMAPAWFHKPNYTGSIPVRATMIKLKQTGILLLYLLNGIGLIVLLPFTWIPGLWKWYDKNLTGKVRNLNNELNRIRLFNYLSDYKQVVKHIEQGKKDGHEFIQIKNNSRYAKINTGTGEVTYSDKPFENIPVCEGPV